MLIALLLWDPNLSSADMVSHETEKTELRIEKATNTSDVSALFSFHRDASATVCSNICRVFERKEWMVHPKNKCRPRRSTARPEEGLTDGKTVER